jgi:cell wall-associated NlpC family hydrolase
MRTIVRLGLIAPLVSLIVAASAQRTITYTVQPGDSLYTIAHKHGLRLPELLEVNNLRNPHALQVGDQIKIPVKGNAAASAQRTAQPAAPASGWAEINKDRINIRTAPSTDAKRITLVDRWTKVQVLGRQGDWSRIRLQSGAVGWVLSKYLSPTKPPQTRQVATRSSARKPAPRTAQASRPERDRQQPTAANLSQTATANGQPAVVRRALGYLGTRYRYGASGARGFDCSGFTSYIYRQHGISSSAQLRRAVPRGQAREPQRTAPRRFGLFPHTRQPNLACGHLHRQREVCACFQRAGARARRHADLRLLPSTLCRRTAHQQKVIARTLKAATPDPLACIARGFVFSALTPNPSPTLWELIPIAPSKFTNCCASRIENSLPSP